VVAGDRHDDDVRNQRGDQIPPEFRAALVVRLTRYVSAGTVKTHVHHIFTKLNLRNRAAAVIFALDHDLATRRTETE
jgi:hypothetical protein